jgi:hypothetical protein
VSAAHPKDVGVPVAARAEMQLCRLARDKLTSYNPGSSTCTWIGDGEPSKEFCDAQAALATVGGSGVLQVMNAAISLRGPLIVYPVGDLDTCRLAKSCDSIRVGWDRSLPAFKETLEKHFVFSIYGFRVEG